MDMTGIPRNLAPKIKRLLTQFPVVAILGPRQAGKTTLAKQIAPTWSYFDLENPVDYDRISHDPGFFFSENPRALILDEAQEYPELFRVLRGEIDKRREEKGRYLITGSSSPELLAGVSESLAGRVALVELGTLKANEFYRKPLSVFYSLFSGKLNKEKVPAADALAPLSSAQIQAVWLKGGYPEPVLEKDESFYQQWMEAYHSTYINRDIAKLFPRLNKVAYRRFLTTLSKLSGTILNKKELAAAIEVSEGTVREYLEIAEGTFLWRQLNSFEKNVVKSVIKMPKGYIRDTGLLHYLLQIDDLEVLKSDPIVGNSFEAFVIEEILKGLQATSVTNWRAYYYRTRNRAEIDLILDGPFGTLPIEIKYGSSTPLRQLIALNEFVDEHKLPFGILINQSDKVTWLTEKVIQIPVGWI
jgi:predicted AAA+ superfamily ATPase